jgi:RND family efflux transporter MFP subunit
MKFASSNLARALSLCLALGASPLAQAATQSCEGITEPVFDVTLSMAVPGIMTVQRFKEGQFVQTNDIILELDSQLEALEVERRRLVMENHKADAESTKLVFDKTASISRDELLKKQADYEVALAEYKIAVEQLQRRKLFAPGAGVITDISLRVGEACSPYQPIVRLVDTRQCYFICNVEAQAAAGLKTGETVKVEIGDLKNPVKVEAKLVFISPVVDSASGLQKVKAIFDNADGKVRPGITGKMWFD